MSGTLSFYLESALLNHVFATPAYPAPAGHYVALYTVAPTGAGGGTEVSGGGYARLSVTFTTATGTPPAVANNATLQWPAATASWGNIVAGGVFDAATAGNMLGSALLTDPSTGLPTSKSIGTGDVLRIPLGDLMVQFVTPSGTTTMGAQAIMRPIPAQLVRA